MKIISWVSGKVGEVRVDVRGKNCLIKEVEALQAMGALITREADSMSAVKFRMRKVDKALWMEMKFYENNGFAEGTKHKRYRDVVQSCFLNRNLDLMSSWQWSEKSLSLEWFRANQIRKARNRFAERGGGYIEYLVLRRIWGYKKKIFDKKRNKQTDKIMMSILTHANPEWREPRSTSARALGSKNHDKMKRRRA